MAAPKKQRHTKLVMKLRASMVRLLGLEMYSGAVPAIAELIANAWDADAPSADVRLPLGRNLKESDEIRVKDDGIGMTFDDVQELYLDVGRNRRAGGTQRTPAGRAVMGRKGIGKLAGFGIARQIEVWTVSGNRITAFRMDYDDILSVDGAKKTEYEPQILANRKLKASDPVAVGTLVILKQLQLRRKIAAPSFRRSMARRFSIVDASFKVKINGRLLRRSEATFQFRFPADGWTRETVEGLGELRWWAGFTKTPIKFDEARGVSVICRGKLAQAPFFFELASGMQAQLGLQYLTGEVEADALDDAEDLIATDRASVRWDHPRARPLLLWGQKKVRLLRLSRGAGGARGARTQLKPQSELRQTATKPSPVRATAGRVCWSVVSLLSARSGPEGAPKGSKWRARIQPPLGSSGAQSSLLQTTKALPSACVASRGLICSPVVVLTRKETRLIVAPADHELASAERG